MTMENTMSPEQQAKVTSEIKTYWTNQLNTHKVELLKVMGGSEEEWQVMEAGLERVKWVRFPIQRPNPSGRGNQRNRSRSV